ncbi:bacteriohemerythrin [Geothrix sp. PMB-07]|uniref:bacteriohemerythrin n=1 Tax=Geothrix sp. PMB-07 TaxID=3068640 RepID=UPI0027413147|nr:bacteriohemerythrin [Geothrix sp. PMB-07]WLT30788.1 bacteriohemerythrin [Geothrix sp. PMB-07]
MAHLEWQPAFEVGHSRIDSDHQALVGAMNQLYEAAHQGQDKEEIAKILNFLRDYTVTHFATEETLMIRHNYPAASDHFAAHAELILQVSDFIADYRTGNIVGVDVMLGFLETWLMNHIQGRDRDLGAYLQGRD